MKRLLVALALTLAACSPEAAHKESATDAAHDSHQAAPAGPVKATGEVVVLQPEFAAVTIRHDPIPEYGMGAMTMEFTTDSADKLKGLKVGDKVSFELTGPTEIETIKVEPAP